MTTSKTILANNTGADLRLFHSHLIAVVTDGTPLPEELSDLLVVTIIEVDDGRRGIVTWA